MFHSVRLETTDWDHKLIRKVFTEVIHEGSSRFIFSSTPVQPGLAPLLAIWKNAGLNLHFLKYTSVFNTVFQVSLKLLFKYRNNNFI